MRNKRIILFATLLFLCGLAVLLYPAIKTAGFQTRERETIRQFEQYRSASKTHLPSDDTNEIPAEKQRSFPELWDACIEYNETLRKTHQAGFTARSMGLPPLDLTEYGWDNEVFATLSIPTADIEAPIYLGASDYNLYRGAAILGQTSLPIGGENTHCVIAGHRTWNGIMHPFLGLQQVEVGDLVYITNPWETLTYRVVDVKIIYPDDTEGIRIRNGQDLVSVFTCTYPSTQRVLVTCERTNKEVENGPNH